ncbi:MAG: hypothetical protein O3A96_05570 [Proteobacteria bacterium]|nr:hypothetical protein [Pseudomonadota bacterium]
MPQPPRPTPPDHAGDALADAEADDDRGVAAVGANVAQSNR